MIGCVTKGFLVIISLYLSFVPTVASFSSRVTALPHRVQSSSFALSAHHHGQSKKSDWTRKQTRKVAGIAVATLFWWRGQNVFSNQIAQAKPPKTIVQNRNTHLKNAKSGVRVVIGSGIFLFAFGAGRMTTPKQEKPSTSRTVEEEELVPSAQPNSGESKIGKLIGEDPSLPATPMQCPNMSQIIDSDQADTDAPLAWRQRLENESLNQPSITQEVLEPPEENDSDAPLLWREELASKRYYSPLPWEIGAPQGSDVNPYGKFDEDWSVFQ